MVDNMISCIEIALKPSLRDAEASSLIQKAASYFGIQIQTARTVHMLTIDSDLRTEDLDRVRQEIFTNQIGRASCRERVCHRV